MINLHFGVDGRYELEAHKVKSGEIISSRKISNGYAAPNLITDVGLDSQGLGANYIRGDTCVVGAGSTPPANGDQFIEDFIAYTKTVQSQWTFITNTTTPPYYIEYSQTWRFGTGVAAGNINNIGIGGTNLTPGAQTILASHALTVDENGNPVTITIESDEILDATFKFRVYLPNGGAPITGTFNQSINNVVTPFDYTIQAANFSPTIGWYQTPNFFGGSNPVHGAFNAATSAYGGVFSGTLGPITGEPNGPSSASWFSITNASYTQGNNYVDITYNLDLNTGNFVIQSLMMQTTFQSMMQMQISPTMTKSASESYNITFRFSWGRYAP